MQSMESGKFAFQEMAPTLEGLFQERPIRDAASLLIVLSAVLSEQVVRVDLPAIRWAFEAAARNDSRGLVKLDALLSSLAAPKALREASLRAGCQQLSKLQPIRGHRFLARYSAAVEAGEAVGHDPVVYGMYLFLFSIPLREGLLNYAYQMARGLVRAAARSLVLDDEQQRLWIEKLCAEMPQSVERSLAVDRKDFFGLNTAVHTAERAHEAKR